MPKPKKVTPPAPVPTVPTVPAAPAVENVPAVQDETAAPIAEGVQADGQGLEPVATAAYEITAQREGFRRAGRAWSRTPTRVTADELSEAQLDALRADPMLDVVAL